MGLVHRDIKPANIILTNGPGAHDLPKVVDFGLVKDIHRDDVKLTREGAVTGTPMYLPPEAINGSGLDGRSDLYALGAVGYCMLTAKPVFDGDTVVAVCSKHLTETPESPSKRLGQSLPADLEGIILQCLAKDPADRPANALALRALLDGCEDAGRWTPADAQGWWDEHAEEIDGLHRDAAESLTTGGRTIDIDFARRGVRSSR
jgi:serine/threonine-protein kinase